MKKGGVVLLLVLLGTFGCGAQAGLLDWFIKIDAPLKKKINVYEKGIAVDDHFRVKTYCSYDFVLRLHHKNKIWNEYADILTGGKDNNGVPIQVNLLVSKILKDSELIIFSDKVFTRTSGWGLEITSRFITAMVLDEGKYRVTLEMLQDTPALNGVQTDFLIGVRPKSSCAKRDSIDANK